MGQSSIVKTVPVNTPSLKGNEAKYLQQCIKSGWVSSEGPFVAEFETRISEYVGRQFGVAVANGSAALDIAVKSLHIGVGDEVIIPALTIISPAFSVTSAGAIPVLVDSDPLTWNMDVSKIEARITPRTRAVIVVHLYGLPAEMDAIVELANKYKIAIIEDAAEMIGQTYKGKKCGSFGHLSVFSFYSNKHITTGEGGMVLCDDKMLADRCRKLRNLSFEPGERRFLHLETGWNYRMTNLQAAIGLAQLEQLSTTLATVRATGKYYHQHLAFLEQRGYQLPVANTAYADNIYWVFGMIAPSESALQRLTAHLDKARVGIRPFFWCMHEQPVFQKMKLFHDEHYPVAESLARRGFYIPGGAGITKDDIRYVVATIEAHITGDV